MHISNQILIIFVAFVGFLLASYIRHKKSSKENLICPLRFKCETVMYSEFSKFLGVHVEILGMFYYGLLALGYGLVVAIPILLTPAVTILLFSVTAVAFVFSMYLTFVQAFHLKEWCSWCLVSAFICLIIFLLSLQSYFF